MKTEMKHFLQSIFGGPPSLRVIVDVDPKLRPIFVIVFDGPRTIVGGNASDRIIRHFILTGFKFLSHNRFGFFAGIPCFLRSFSLTVLNVARHSIIAVEEFHALFGLAEPFEKLITLLGIHAADKPVAEIVLIFAGDGINGGLNRDKVSERHFRQINLTSRSVSLTWRFNLQVNEIDLEVFKFDLQVNFIDLEVFAIIY